MPAPTNPAEAVLPPPRTEDVAPHITGQTHGNQPPIEFRFFEQLKRRNVIRVGILYVVVCWLVLEPVHVVFHMLEVPAWTNRVVVVLMAIGFPAVLLFGWVYEITPEGLKLTVEVEPSRSIRKQTGQRLNRAIFAVMVVALTYFVVDKFWLSQHVATEQRVTPVASVALSTAPAPTPHIGQVRGRAAIPRHEQHDGGLADLKVDPMFRKLERDPRYKALLHKLRLP